ncbi:undecaprenyl-phosphate glucose phosphotransferase [Neotamlana laminarinivorans]|uniref:Undecaprenyl-phosphate glucose phosphotransferase n=1 Tax=Neotamlana laminarinivorans TaxID=2883124 RepID=A0A9X1HYX5_9FLAO|nr:undecaprenyl-phosphate glucose phosphotransferase [Tamlana laminarinivorans]MCB4798331.1 undecaprenyl-phosphate glucose phosphotransferase [Tamlana laminarinivorans]
MRKGGYSIIIKPLLYIIDLTFISFLSLLLLTDNIKSILFFNFFWIITSVFVSFYNVYRFTKIVEVLTRLTKQNFLFILLVFTYLFINKSNVDPKNVLSFFFWLYFSLILWRVLLYFLFRRYRIITGSNYKQVVIIGVNNSTKKLEKFFNNHPGFGYKFMGFFTDDNAIERKGAVLESYDFIIKNEIDEVYCSVKELTNKQIKDFINFCDINMKSLKFIPDNKELFTKNLYLNYLDITPILSLRKIPLEDSINSVVKRLFDIVFSTLIIVFVLSWLIPILGLIIVLESKGPIFFRQDRPGIKEEGFGCYKFRSMAVNTSSEKSATRNDARVTRVGKFIRRTSIDELPQFFNVLFGSMSVVGPRPHLWRQNEMYGTKVPKYMVRHYVKPGVTGLAQVRGYRGEIETKEDIINRTKYDIFYIENWSILLDINIIIQTVVNVFKGEEKAY